MSMEWDDDFAMAQSKSKREASFQWDEFGFSPAQMAEARARKRRPPTETDFFRSFLNTTREEHRSQLNEATKSMREANISQRVSSARSAGTEGQEEREERQKESATRTYLDFLLNKRQQTARERMKELREYGYKVPEGRGHLSFLEERVGDRRQVGRPYSFPLGADRSVPEDSYLRDMSTFDSQAGSGYGGELSAILAEGQIKWDSPGKNVDISAVLNEEWDKSIRSTPGRPGKGKSSASIQRGNILHGQSFPQRKASDRRQVGRPYSFPLGADRSAPQDSYLRDMSTFDSQIGSGYGGELSAILAEGQIKWDSPEKKGDASALLKEDWDKSIRSTPGRSAERDRLLREPSYLKDLADLQGSHAKAAYKEELGAILDKGKAKQEDWEKGQDQADGADKSFVELLENLKDDPGKGFEYLINDVYYPGVIDDAVNGKLDFNKLAFMIAFSDEKVPDELPPPERQPISLAEAFDRRCEKHTGAIKKTTMQSTKGTGLGGKASTATTDKDDLSRPSSKSSLYNLLPRKATLTRILNREELVLASTVGIDVSTIVQNRPVNELIKAMNSLQKAEYMNDFDKSSQAAEEAFKRAPPELAESAAIYGAKNFRTIELTKKSATLKREPGYKPIEVVSYMGMTKPMADVRV